MPDTIGSPTNRRRAPTATVSASSAPYGPDVRAWGITAPIPSEVAMELTDIVAALEAAGTEQNRKIYPRHGVTSPLHGVSFADYRKLAKQIGTDHDAALGLWATGNHDARMLATMVADPNRMGRRVLDAWIREVDNYVLADAVAELAARTPHRDSRADKWTVSRAEFTAHAGWALVGHQALNDDTLPDAYFGDRLAQIEATMADAPNRTRHAMHMTLISIGGRSKGLRRRAVAATKRIGTPDVDHGQTSCTTPDAIPYIDRMWDRKAAAEARAAAKAAGKPTTPPQAASTRAARAGRT